MKPDRISVAIVAAAACGMLLYALFGSPSYGYFGFMKIAVLGASLYVAWGVFERSPKLAPLALAVGSLGFFEFFGKMRREEWVPWNWAMVAALVAGASVAWWPSPKETEEDAGE